MRYKRYRLRRYYDVEDGEMVVMLTNIMIGGTVVALVLALPTVAILLTIYHISNDVMLAALASIALHYAILILFVERISMKIYSMLEGDGEREGGGEEVREVRERVVRGKEDEGRRRDV
nr:hypothetical protein HGIII-11 [uncultured Candidatus Nitrosocaldus sp.]